jgi:hypothetical protein
MFGKKYILTVNVISEEKSLMKLKLKDGKI